MYDDFDDGEDAVVRPRKLKSRRLSEVAPSKAPKSDEPIRERSVLYSEADDESDYVRRHVRRRTDDGEIPESAPKRRKAKSPTIPDREKSEADLAREAALRILSYGANTRKRLCDKLTDRGFSDEAVKSACDRLEAEGILSDRREIFGAVMSLAKRYGPGRIPPELKRLGFTSETIREVDYDELEIDFIPTVRRIIESKGYDEKTHAYLRNRGYTETQIRRALSESEE